MLLWVDVCKKIDVIVFKKQKFSFTAEQIINGVTGALDIVTRPLQEAVEAALGHEALDPGPRLGNELYWGSRGQVPRVG